MNFDVVVIKSRPLLTFYLTEVSEIKHFKLVYGANLTQCTQSKLRHSGQKVIISSRTVFNVTSEGCNNHQAELQSVFFQMKGQSDFNL